MTRPRSKQLGVSLVEALVALGVMAFGILGIAGIQSSLRTNSDIAKQRSEALRVAQQLMEDRRGFQSLDVDGATPSFNGIVTESLGDLVGTNATFSRSVTATDANTGRVKNLIVTVQWTDRAGEVQRVELRSSIAGNTPELSGSLGTAAPGGTQRLPQGRHPGVPRGAADLGGGTSKFLPPGGAGQYWIFSNTTGVILERCDASDVCITGKALLLAGFVRFSTGNTQPGSSDAELPASPVVPGLGAYVDQQQPFSQLVDCFVDPSTFAGAVAYYCAVPITDDTPNWDGRSLIAGIALASSDGDADASKYRVCRYTRDLAHTAVGSGTPPMANRDHPRDYVKVDSALTNQNFLVIKAGDDSTAFSCPDDDTSTPFINGRTYKHQPG